MLHSSTFFSSSTFRGTGGQQNRYQPYLVVLIQPKIKSLNSFEKSSSDDLIQSFSDQNGGVTTWTRSCTYTHAAGHSNVAGVELDFERKV